MKKLLYVVMLLAVVASQFSMPLTSYAQEPDPSATPSAEASATDTTTPEVTPSATPQPDRPTPESPTATVQPSETPSLTPSETPSPAPTTATAIQSATASVTAIAGTIQLSLTPTPSFITPGGMATLHWTIQGIDPTTHILVLQMVLLAGVTPKAGEGTVDPASGLLTVPVINATGQFHLSLGASSDSVTFQVSLMEAGQSLATAQVTIIPQEQFTMGIQGGIALARGGHLKIIFPPGALAENAQITVTNARALDAPKTLSGHAFTIKAHGLQSGLDLHQFNQNIEIQAQFADFGIQPGQKHDIRLWWYDPDLEEWAALPSGYDPASGTVDGITTHFSTFDIDPNNWQASMMPRVDDFAVADSTGASTYTLPIHVPDGPGGLRPDLALTYNSQIVDQSTTITQPDWVGIGWNLDTGSITLDQHGTDDATDDSWMLNAAGVSTRFIKLVDGTYHALNENFWKITYSPSTNAWTVYDKTGTIYTFGEATNLMDGECGEYPYLWSLSSVQNIFGQ